MADAQANININLDASQALAQLRALQAEISTFQQKMLKLNANTAASAANVQRNLLNTINATGKFSAGMTTVASSTETFTNSLEKNKFSMGEYFRYAGGASKTFGKLFTNEFNTIEKVARERVKTLQTQYIKLGREANGAMKAISVRPLALDMDNLATRTMMAAQKQQILNQLLKQGSTNLLNFGKNTQWAGRQLMVGFTIPLTIFGSLAAKTFMELEEQAIRFKRVYGELFTTQEETDKMLDQLKVLGSEFTKYGVALKDTMAMAADAAAMGKTGVDLLTQVAQASRLAVLGGVEQQEALETTISLTNAFGVATEDLTKKIDFLNAVENQTVVSIEDLTIAIPKAGPVVKQLGGDVEDLAFFLTAMKEGGINASEGANALKSGLASLINPSAKASEFLSGLGINIKSIVEGNAGDIKGTVVQFAQALDTLDPLNRARAIEQLFGKFQFSRLSTLFQNVVAEGTQASRVLGLTAASTEELAILSERELKRIESSPMFKFKKAFEDLQAAMAPVGEQFLKAITPIIEFGTKLLEKFNSMSDGSKQFMTILVAGLGVVAPTLLMIIGLVGNGVANIAKFMLFLKGIGKGGAGVQQLGMQTQYMTQEQLEANAAAAALSQTHARLQQTFTSETAAVKALAAAYREAAIASRAIMGVPAARGRGAGGARAASKPAGYADGIVSVPGPKGAGDVVPAMLSPGEAVIPAKQSKKYAGFIRSMIADNVPGFAKGTDNQAISSTIARSLFPAATTPDDLSKRLPLVEKTINKLVNALGPEKVQAAMGKLTGTITSNAGLMEKEAYKQLQAQKLASKPLQQLHMDAGRQISANQLAGKMGNLGGGKLINSIAAVNPNALVDIKGGWTRAGSGVVNRGLTASNAKQGFSAQGALADYQKSGVGKYQKAVKFGGGELNSPELKEAFTAYDNKMVALQQAAIRRGVKFFADTNADIDQFINKAVKNGDIKNTEAARAKLRSQYASYEDFDRKAATVLTGKAAEVRNTAINTAKVVRYKSTDSDITRAQALIDNPKTPEATKAQARHFLSQYQNQANVGRERPFGAKGQAVPANISDNTEAVKGNTEQGEKATKATREATKATNRVVSQSPRGSVASRIETKVNKLGQTYYVLDGKQISKDKAEKAFANQERGRKAAETRRQNRPPAITTPSTADPAQRGAGRGMGMGGVGMLAMTAGMMAPMLPGKAGEIGGQLAGPLMALGMLSMLPPKIAIVTGALALMGISIYSMINAFSKSTKEMMALTESLGAGSKSIAGLSEFAGTVSSGELMDRRRESMFTPYQIQPGKTTFGSSFVQSEQGTAMIESMKTALKSQGMRAVQSQVINQMSTAIATGALNPDQARSIIYELGKQLGDFSFGISVNGKLSQLIGPNGENLLTDPLGIRLKIMQESIDATQDSLEAMDTSKVGNRLGLKIGAGIAISAGTTIAGTLGGAALGAKIGAAIGTAAAPGVGTAIGAVAGLAVGVGITALMTVKDFEKIGNLSGAVIANSVMLVQQRQQILDSLDVEYEKRIAAAKAAGNVAEADRLTNQYLEDRQKFLSSTSQAISDVAKQIANAPSFLGLFGEKNALMSTLDEAVKMAYADNPLTQMMAAGVQEQIKDIDFGNTEREITLSLLLASKDIDPAALSGFLAAFGDDIATVDTFLNIATNLGGAEGGRVLQVMNLFKDDVNKTQFLAEVKARGTDAKGFLDAFQQIAQVEAGGQVDIQASLDFYLNNPEILADYEEDMQRLRDQAESGAITQPFIVQYIGEDVADIIATDQAYFDSLPPLQQVTYVQTVRTMFETYGEDYRETKAFKSWDASQKSDVPDEAFFTQSANQLTAAEALVPDAGEMEDIPSGGGGGGKKTSPLDDILKKLRDYRKIQIGILEGWQAISNRINELFSSGGLSGFTGMAQQMRSLGAGENLIELIVGMDPDEYERRKDELFIFDENGNIAALTNQAVNLGRALNAITLGEFVNEQQQTLRNFKNQIMATRTLTNAGLSLADAYEMAGDAALAAAIVAEKNIDNIRQMVALAKEAQKISEDVAAAQAVAQKNQSQTSLNNILSFMRTGGQALTDAQKTAILGDEDLQKLVLDPAIDPQTLRTALANAEQQAALQLSIKKLTFEGLQEIFSDGFNKAMESFSVKEQQINLKFNVSKKSFEDIVKANQQITEDITNRAGGLDDLRADLDRMSSKEKDINDKYDLRAKTLNKINEINQKNAALQKSQIDIADALSRGDISAAARAVAEQKSQDQQNAIEQQTSSLAQQKELELSGLRNNQGQTRLEIQKQIAELERQIFEIEESAIEPAQRQIALLERQQQLEIESLTVLGRTRLEWEQVKNRVDLAVIGTDQFRQAMEEALGVVTDIATYWNDFNPADKNFAINVKQRVYDVDEPDGTPGPEPRPDIRNGPGGNNPPPPPPPPDTSLSYLDRQEQAMINRNRPTGGSGRATIPADADQPSRTMKGRGYDLSFETPDWLKGLGENLSTVAETIGAAWVALGQIIDEKFFQPIRTKISEITTKIKTGWNTMVETIKTKWTNWWNENIQPKLDYLANVWETVKTNFNTMVEDIKKSWNDWWNENIQPKIDDITNMWTKVKDAFILAFEEIGTWWDGWKETTFDEKVATMKSGFELIFDPETWKGWFKLAMDAILNQGKILVNQLVAMFNKIKLTIPATIGGIPIPLVGGKSFGFSIPVPFPDATSKAMGGQIKGYPMGGLIPYKAEGGFFKSLGSDTVPAMLTPGEFVVRRPAVRGFGVKNLEKINRGTYSGGSMYNYSLEVNVKSDSSPEQIASTVMRSIKQIEGRRIKGNSYNG